MSSRITLHMVSSLDGFIAKKNGNIDWMHSHDTYEKGIELTDEYVDSFLKSIDCYVMGSRTYEHALKLGWPYGDTPVIVLSSQKLSSEKKSVKFHSGDLATLVQDHLKPTFHNIWVVGGAMLAKEFLRLNLVDEIVVSIIPVLLGEGLPFFDDIGIEKTLHLKDHVAYKDGMVELTYAIGK